MHEFVSRRISLIFTINARMHECTDFIDFYYGIDDEKSDHDALMFHTEGSTLLSRLIRRGVIHDDSSIISYKLSPAEHDFVFRPATSLDQDDLNEDLRQ